MKTKTREDIYTKIMKLPKPLRKIACMGYYNIEKKKVSMVKTPQVLNFFITDRCNLRCSHCFYWKHLDKPTQELSLKGIEKMIRSLKNPLLSVVLTGGETYLRKDLVEICMLFDRINKTKKVILATNGICTEVIYEKTKQILDKTNLDVAVQISLDGLEKTHDNIRGVTGTFQKVIRTIRELKTLNRYKRFNLSLSTTISKKNYKEVGKLIKFVKEELGISHGLQFVRDSEEHTFNIDKKILSDFTSKDILSLEEMKNMNQILERHMEMSENPLLLKVTNIFNNYAIKILEGKRRLMKCSAGELDGVILTNGDVAFCEFTKPFANLRDYDFDFYRLWTSEKADEMRNKIRTCACIHPCNLMNSMRYDFRSIKKMFDAE